MGGGLPGRRVRRPRRPDGPARPARARLPGRHAVREPGGRRRRARPRCGTAPTRSTRAATRPPRCSRGGRERGAVRRRASRTGCSTAGSMFSIFFVPDERQVRDYDDARSQDVARYPAFFHAMLARGRLPAAVGLRGLVRQRRHDGEALDRVARGAAAPPPAPPRRPRRRRRDRADDRAPAPPRRGPQPRQILYGRLPGYRLSDAGLDGRAGRRRFAEPGRHPPRRRPAGARAADGRARSPRRSALPVHDRRPADRGRQRLRGPGVRRRRRRAARTAALVEAAQPVPALVGRALRRDRRARMLAAVEAARDAARGHEAVLVSHQLPIWTLRLHVEGRRTCTTRAGGVRPGQRHVGDLRRRPDGRRSPTPSRPGPPTPDAVPGRMRRFVPARLARGALLLAGCSTGAGRGRRQQRRRVPLRRRHARRRGRSRRTSGPRPRSSPARCSTAADVLLDRARRPGRRPELLGIVVRALPGGDAGVPATSTPRSRDQGVAVPRARTSRRPASSSPAPSSTGSASSSRRCTTRGARWRWRSAAIRPTRSRPPSCWTRRPGRGGLHRRRLQGGPAQRDRPAASGRS